MSSRHAELPARTLSRRGFGISEKMKNPSKKHWFQIQKIRIWTFEFLNFAFAADFLFSFFIHFFKMYLCSS